MDQAKALNDNVSHGDEDGFITGFEAESGNIIWTRQFGTSGFDSVHDLGTDKEVW